jgi:D-alanyl-lipoteichoic acid acyltransferase DltB (MBOAT superfamily)
MGIFIFSMGLFKKVVIADTFSLWATAGFDSGQSLNIFEAWVTSLSYTFQIYFDFSGYTDMAIGIGLLFNINLPINFNSPYKAKNIQDFWRRWHITLSRFLRDYIYIPLGGSRDRDYRTYINLKTTEKRIQLKCQ